MAQKNDAVAELEALIKQVKASTYTVEQAAVRLGVVEMRVRNLCREGKLQATKVNGTWVIDKASVEAYATKKVIRVAKANAKKAARTEYEAAIAKLDAEIATLVRQGDAS
jgi:excisionase family DNA binding protein